MNESIYYNVDEIHNGISSNRKIRFLYFEYNVAKERVYRHGGAYYVVSPFAMTWDDENYYMVAFDSAAGIIKHYRVDKMEKITVLDEERDGQDAYEALDMAVYARKTFGMFTGEEVKVHLRFENHLVGAVLDRLGRDVILVPDGEDHFTVWTDVIVSPQFFAWLCGFQTAAKVIGPDDVVKQMAEHVKSIAAQYEKSLNLGRGGTVYVLSKTTIGEISKPAIYAGGFINGNMCFPPFSIRRLCKSIWHHRPSRCMVGLSEAKKRCAADSSTRSYRLFLYCPSRGATLLGL